MAELYPSDADDYDYDTQVVSTAQAEEYAIQVATEAVLAYKGSTETSSANSASKDTNMSELQDAATAVAAETTLAAKLISGEILLDNIETVANKLVMSRLGFWQRLSISKSQKKIAITLATYGIVHALKTGGFGLTKYRINHAALDYVTIAANARMLRFVVQTVGVDTNIAEMFLTAPTVTSED